MCAEREPLDCHRTILVARRLAALSIDVTHIHADGRAEAHTEALSRLLHTLKLRENDLFRSRDDLIDEAYRLQEERIAFVASDRGSAAGHRLRDTTE
jgi:hypothetical protein